MLQNIKKIIKLTAITLAALILITGCSAVDAPAPSGSQRAAAPTEQTSQAPAAASAPAATQTQTSAEEGQLIGAPWINSALIGNLPEVAPDLTDDFYLNQNYEWIKSAKLPQGASSYDVFDELGDARKEQILEIINGTDEGHEQNLVRTLYNAVIDMDTRNKLGVEPIMPYVKDIEAVKSIDDLTALTTDYDRYLGLNFLDAQAVPDAKDSTAYVVNIGYPIFYATDADAYKSDEMPALNKLIIDSFDTFFSKSLQKLGYSKQQADAMNKAANDVEKKIALNSKGSSVLLDPTRMEEQYNPRTFDELKAEGGAFPVTELLESFGYGENLKYILTDPGWLKGMDGIYSEENLEGLKALAMRGLIISASGFLDQEFLDITNELNRATSGAESDIPPEENAYKLVDTALGNALGKIYIERYFDEDTKKDVEDMTAKIKDAFKKRIESADWLSDETKAKAIEKIDAMAVSIGYPDVWADYSTLVFPETGEDANLLNYVKLYGKFNEDENIKKISKPVVKGNWAGVMTPYEINAFYKPSDNSINIPAGILGGVFYNPNASWEYNLAATGTTIGHEISHAFDTSGSQYDKDGNRINWWTDEDAAAFAKLTGKVSDYYSSMEVFPGEFVNGDITVTEAVADLSGVAAVLDVAAQDPDFDYEEFFKAFAAIWPEILTRQAIESNLQSNSHAPDYIRTNATVQQFPEFYETYGIKEGDGMYLAEEDRLSVW